MSSGSSRPGGLTALAVFNFIFGGMGLLGLLGYVFMMVALSTQATKPPPGLPSLEYLIVLTILGGIANSLLLVCGIGYIMQKRFLGRMLGTLYGVFGLINVIVAIVAFTSSGGDVGLLNIVGFIYPVLTLVLLHTTFRADFVN